MMPMRRWPSVVRYVAGEIQDRREKFGWTQDDLARAARLHRGAVARLEQGIDSSLPLRTLWAVAWALGCDPADLMPPRLP